ncbi:DUF805 domain-containing protein [Pseudomonas sp. SP16.1]|uniref:DUF805 domain-containing protein n=1 Tax=Pseudomonas sp. SP16.1 TaxID=3458854 RepID=UPI00404685FA
MNSPRYKIVFDGELMPEMTLDSVKDNLARLFKSDMARINGLFSGAQVALKRGLGESEADQYLNALQKAGAKVRKELDHASGGLSLLATDDHPVEKPSAAQPDTPTVTCPRCAHEQPQADECSACGIIIEKYLARQAQQAAMTQGAPAAAPSSASPYAPPRANVAEQLPEFSELKVFGVSGRIGRVRYLGWSMAMFLCTLPVLLLGMGAAALSDMLGMLLLAAALVTMMVVSVCFGVQRLHDIGWSGWLWLVNFIPVVGGVFALLMLIIPGSQGVNRFGPPPPPNSGAVKLLAWLFLLVPITGIIAAITIPQYQGYVERAAEYQGQ